MKLTFVRSPLLFLPFLARINAQLTYQSIAEPCDQDQPHHRFSRQRENHVDSHLLAHKDPNEKWAVLVNEFGKSELMVLCSPIAAHC